MSRWQSGQKQASPLIDYKDDSAGGGDEIARLYEKDLGFPPHLYSQ